jgi:hypothetical protein
MPYITETKYSNIQSRRHRKMKEISKKEKNLFNSIYRVLLNNTENIIAGKEPTGLIIPALKSYSRMKVAKEIFKILRNNKEK